MVENPSQFGEGAEGDVIVDGIGEVSGPDEGGEAILVAVEEASSLGMVHAIIAAAAPTTVVPEEVETVVEGQLVADLVGGLDIEFGLPFVVLMVPADIEARMPREVFRDGEVASGDVKHNLAFGFAAGRPLRAFRVIPVGVGQVERQAFDEGNVVQRVVVTKPVVPFFRFVVNAGVFVVVVPVIGNPRAEVDTTEFLQIPRQVDVREEHAFGVDNPTIGDVAGAVGHRNVNRRLPDGLFVCGVLRHCLHTNQHHGGEETKHQFFHGF